MSAFDCDFDAPMYVDFNNIDDDQNNPDSFFDNRAENDVVIPNEFADDINEGLASTSSRPKATPAFTDRVTRSAKAAVKTRPRFMDPTNKARRRTNADGAPQQPPNSTAKKFVSMVEETKKFYGTPERFRSRQRHRSADTIPDAAKNLKNKFAVYATEPQSPKLLTRSRSRSRVLKSADTNEKQASAFPTRSASTTRKPPPVSNLGLQRSQSLRRSAEKPKVDYLAANKRLSPYKNKNVKPSSPLKIRPGSGSVSKAKTRSAAKAAPHMGIPLIFQAKHNSKMPDNKLVGGGTSKNKFSGLSAFKPKAASSDLAVKKVCTKHAPVVDDKENRKAKPLKALHFHKDVQEMFKDKMKKRAEAAEKAKEDARRAAEFKAAEAKVLAQRPFLPHPSDRDPVTTDDVHLHTEERVTRRRVFEMTIKQKEAELQSLKLREQEKRKIDEIQEMSRLRKATVHKPLPIRTYHPVDIHPSDKPLTQPKTPAFSKSRSLRKKSSTS